MREVLSCGDEIRVGTRPAYYGVVMAVRPRLVIRIRRGGPHGPLVADLEFGDHPTRGELLAASDARDPGGCPGK